MSRERDSRRLNGFQERSLPRNMQSAEPAASDADGFINIQLQLPPAGERREDSVIEEAAAAVALPLVARSASDLTEAELAEADQVRPQEDGFAEQSRDRALPTHLNPFPNRDPDCQPSSGGLNQVPMMLGLDRVPIRLPSCQDLEVRRQQEDEAVASLVEEVLASSPELANNVHADQLPDL